jgi:hypothetical protein
MNLPTSPLLPSPRIAARKTYQRARGPRRPLPDAAHHGPIEAVEPIGAVEPVEPVGALASAPPASALPRKTESQDTQGLRKLARGCLALALLTLASCAHCQRCCQNDGRDGARCAMHGESTSCSKCPAPTGAKGARTKATPGQKDGAPAAESSKPTPDKRKAKAELPGTQTQPPQPLWFRWR